MSNTFPQSQQAEQSAPDVTNDAPDIIPPEESSVDNAPSPPIATAPPRLGGRNRKILAVVVLLAAIGYLASDLKTRGVDGMESQDLGFSKGIIANGHYSLPPDQSPLYYAFLHFWQQLNKSSYAFLRFPSCVFGGLAVMFVFLLMEAEAGAAAGLLAGAFLLLNPFLVYWARCARSYALVAGLAAGAFYFAYRYLTYGRKARDLRRFVAFSVLVIFTHIYSLIFIGCLGLLMLIDLIRHRASWKILLGYGALGTVLIAPQLHRIFRVMAYTNIVSAQPYEKLPKGLYPFFYGLAKDFFLGIEGAPGYAPYAVLAIFILFLLGIAVSGRRGLIGILFLFLPTLIVSYKLSFKNPIGSRYMIYLVPPAVCYLAAAAARFKSFFWRAPIAALLLVCCAWFTHREFPPKPLDWNTAVEFIDQHRQPGDAIAVFPAHWGGVLRRFYHHDDIPSFNSISGLQRVLARGQRVFIVAGPSKNFSNGKRYIHKNLKVLKEFTTKVRKKIQITYVEAAKPEPVELASTSDPTILIAGVVGSGGYPWQLDANGENPFAELMPVFKQADMVLAGYEAYAPPPAWKHFFFNLKPIEPCEPNSRVAGLLHDAGIGAVVLRSPEIGAPDPVPLLDDAGIRALPTAKLWASAKPTILQVKDISVAVLAASQNIYADRPAYREKNDALVADWEKAVKSAREAVGPRGRLVVLLPQKITPRPRKMSGWRRIVAEYDEIFTPDSHREDRMHDSVGEMLARRAIDLGADAVVGLGDWTAREYEEYGNGIILHSLGTLLRPPHLPDVGAVASGMMVRLTFPEGEPARHEIIPVTFDDTFRAHLGQRKEVASLAYKGRTDKAAEHLFRTLIGAKVEFILPSGKRDAIVNWTDSLRPLESVHEGYSNNSGWVGVGDSRDWGIFHRALIIKPNKAGTLQLTFEKVALGEAMQISYGEVDSNGMTRQKAAQDLAVAIEDHDPWRRRVTNFTGWKTESIDTKSLAGQRKDITISVKTDNGRNFWIAADPVVIRGPEALQAMEAQPYAFDDHIGDATVAVVNDDGTTINCAGPDDAFRLLRGGAKRRLEENGPRGEGILYRRWWCGDIPWDGVALTFQKSAGELRNAIWLHPLENADRVLTYGPLTLRKEISGFLGMTDLAVQNGPTPVSFSVRVDGQEIYALDVPGESGWKPFRAYIPKAMIGRTARISFHVRTAKQSWRHFCFNASME